MKSRLWHLLLRGTSMLLLTFYCRPGSGQELRLLSQVNSAVPSPSGGGGGSWSPILSPDGRFVVFASTANNLLLTSNGAAIPLRIPPTVNVYLRDRLYGTNVLVSVNLTGVAGGNADSIPSGVSPDGRFVLFESSASDLVLNDTNGASDIFVRDLATGAMILVSASTNGVPGNGTSRSAVMTPDGRYVAFVSAAFNLVPGDTNKIEDVFVRDLQTSNTVWASFAAVAGLLNGSSGAPDISADGRYVVFQSSAAGMVNVGSNRLGSDIYIRDLQANTTLLASAYSRNVILATFIWCFNHVLSADANCVVYEAAADSTLTGKLLRYNIGSGQTDIIETNAAVPRSAYEDIRSVDLSADGRFVTYVANQTTTDGTTTCIKLWDGQTASSTIISGNFGGIGVPPGSYCDSPSIDSSGRYVVFLSSATNMVTNAVSGTVHLYLHDTLNNRRLLIDADTNGIGSVISPATAPRLSSDGRFVAFECDDSSLVASDSNHDPDVFFLDTQTAGMELISAHDPALPSRTPNGPCSLTANSISADGRFVAFASEADNLIAGDTNALRDIFIADLADGSVRAVSVDTNGLPADGVSSDPAISDDGRFVAFTSMADNIVTGDTNVNRDVFVRDLQNGTTTLVSVNSTGTGPGNGSSYSPRISSDGRFVLFRSQAKNLAAGSYLNENLFVRDFQRGVTYALSTAGITSASTTADGRLVAYIDYPGATAARYYVFDAVTGLRVTNTATATLTNILIGPGGGIVAYVRVSTNVQLSLAALQGGVAQVIAAGTGQIGGLSFSADSSVLAYWQKTNGYKQVFCYELSSAAAVLVSRNYLTGLPGSDDSDSPALSPDGRFIVYRSGASGLISGDTNGVPDLFIYDRQTGANSLLTANASGTSPANNRSLMPVFSRDGTRLFFVSWGSDLAGTDFNHSSDLFSYAFLAASVAANGGNPTISWPWLAGKNYKIEYKDNLSDPTWQEAQGTISHVGVKGILQDASAGPSMRFYRVRCF